MPNLTSVGNILLTPVVTSSASKKVGAVISFPSVILCAAFRITPSAGIGVIDFTAFAVSSIYFGSGIPVISMIAPLATNIIFLNPSPVASLSIIAPNATNVSIGCSAVTGSFNIQTSIAIGSAFTAPALTTIGGNASITAGTFAANACTNVGGNLSISSNNATMLALATVVGNVEVTGTGSTTADSANFANLTNVGGDLSIDAVDVSQDTGQAHNSGGNSQTHNSGGNG